jgi:hypothetical protein
LSKRIKSYFPQEALEQTFVPFAGKPIQLPHKVTAPSAECLRYHRESVFSG